MTSKVAVPFLALAFALAGCGGGGDADTSGEPAPPAGSEPSGEALFTANCASCHSLAVVGATGTFGPDLDDRQPDAARVEAMVRNGGGAMPAFGDKLTDDEITTVSQFVAENAGS
jgi:mono/diheme cytochrome c family protein